MLESPHLVTPGMTLRLADRPTDPPDSPGDRADAAATTAKLLEELVGLQELLYAEAKHAVLVVFQAMDAGGKDGAIRSIFSGVNPQGCQVTSFKAPSTLERAHDFLWRVHAAAPPKGMIGIFNRSHYESVLVERVRGLAPAHLWPKRYDHINAFERLLADEGTTILKFFLHISKDEQKRRLQKRLDNPAKHWKFDPNDLAERKRWDEYQAAYEEALARCSTPQAPWYVVPSDRKWYRNYVVADVLVRALRGLRMAYPPPAPGIEKLVVD